MFIKYRWMVSEDVCEDCGLDFCRCPDDLVYESKFITPPVVFVLEEQIEKLKTKLEEEKKNNRLLKTFREWQKADYEELDLLRTFIIVKDLEEEFDKWVSERLGDESK